MMKLHLGCGKRDWPGWTNIDGGNFPHLHSHDITKLPYQDNVADLIYSSHVIEYFDRDEVVPLLKEWKRVLKEGGVLRLAVPDFQVMSHLYSGVNYPLEKFLGMLYGKMSMGEKTIYHKTVYDFNNLSSLLASIDFKSIKKYDFRYTEHSQFDDHSKSHLPHNSDAIMSGNFESLTLMSLNIECKK